MISTELLEVVAALLDVVKLQDKQITQMQGILDVTHYDLTNLQCEVRDLWDYIDLVTGTNEPEQASYY